MEDSKLHFYFLLMVLTISLLSLQGCTDEEEATSSEPSNWSIGTPLSPFDTSVLPNLDQKMKVLPNTSLSDSLLYTLQTTNGGTIRYFGDKSDKGSHLSVKVVCMGTTSAQEIVILVDNLGHPTHISRGDGKLIQFDWNSRTVIESNGSISCDEATKQAFVTQAVRQSLSSVEQAPYKTLEESVLKSQGQTLEQVAQENCMKDYLNSKDPFQKACGVVTALSYANPALAAILGVLCIYSDEILDSTFGASWESYCKETHTACNSTSQSGHVGSHTHYLELGKNSGFFELSYSFYSIPDQLYVLYDGKSIYRTSCSGGSQSVSIPFSGSSTSIAVEVFGDCTNKGSTDWNYTISCP